LFGAKYGDGKTGGMRMGRFIISIIGGFVFYYPIVMSLVWMIGGLLFYNRMKKSEASDNESLVLDEQSFVSVLIPARNEQVHIEETIRSVLRSDYKNLEIVVINDASGDKTEGIVRKISQENEKVRLLNLRENMGKAAGLNYAMLVSKGDIIVTIDADCLLREDCISRMVWHFLKFPRVGAVTGNPRIKNVNRLLTHLQALEYSNVIGLIKRTHRMLGKLHTVSGVVAAFRRRALVDAGLWSEGMLTEDIDISWKLEQHFWDIRYEEKALCWIIAPETMMGLLRQRIRWCAGGAQVLKKHWRIWKDFRMRRMWPLYIDYFLSIAWAYTFIIGLILWTIQSISGIGIFGAELGNPIPLWRGAVIMMVCLVQFGISIWLDRKQDKKIVKSCIYTIWYPVIYWIVQAIAAVIGSPKGFFRGKNKAAVWVSPDRGIFTDIKEALPR